MITEADTFRQYVLPKLRDAGWEDAPHSIAEQKTFTDGRIVVVAGVPRRAKPKRADYLLRFTRDFVIRVVEAKAAYLLPGDGLQQAKEYAEMLGLKFAYSTNGHGIVGFDFISGKEAEIERFPTPVELWTRLQIAEGVDERIAERFLEPLSRETAKEARYYQSNRSTQLVGQAFNLAVRRRELNTKLYIRKLPENNTRQSFFEHDELERTNRSAMLKPLLPAA